MRLPTTLIAIIFSAAQIQYAQADTDPIYLTNYTTYPNISLSLTPHTFLSLPGSNGSSSISPSSLSSPGSTIKYPLDIAVRDFQNIKKPHFSTTQTLIWLDTSSVAGSGWGNKTVMDGWVNCFVFFKNLTTSAQKAGLKDDGSCGETLGSNCVSDLEQGFKMSGGGTRRCKDLVIESLPKSCEGKIDVTGREVWTVADVSYNNESYYPLFEVQTPMHRWDNETYLQVAAETVWPVLWYQSLNQAGIAASNGSFTNPTTKAMGCLRATTKNNGTTSDATFLKGMGCEQQWITVAVLAAFTAWNLS